MREPSFPSTKRAVSARARMFHGPLPAALALAFSIGLGGVNAAQAQVQILRCGGDTSDFGDNCSLAEMYNDAGAFIFPDENITISFPFAPPLMDGFATDLSAIEVNPLEGPPGPGLRMQAPPGTWAVDGDGSLFNSVMLSEIRLLAGASTGEIDVGELHFEFNTDTSYDTEGAGECGGIVGGIGGYVDGTLNAAGQFIGSATPRTLGGIEFSAPEERVAYLNGQGLTVVPEIGVIPFSGDLSGLRAVEIFNLTFTAADCGTTVAASAEIESIALRFVGAGAIGQTAVVSAVLPTSRSVQVGQTATAFATMINSGASVGSSCRIAPAVAVAADFSYQTTDPATNELTGTVNTPVDIAAGGSQSFVIALTPSAPIAPTDVAFDFFCDNADPALSVAGLNTLLLSAEDTPVPDIVALSATVLGGGVVDLTPSGFFSVATVNVGASASITARADTGSSSLPLALLICETDPLSGECLAPAVDAGAGVTTAIDAGATPTFAVFITATDTVPFDPATNRVVARFVDAGGVTRGATSVAVRSVP